MSKPRKPQIAVTLHVACNDPDNGMFTGKFDAAEISAAGCDTIIRLDGPDTRIAEIRDPSCTPKSRLRVGRLVMPLYGSREWVGSWCWDAYKILLPDAVRVLNYLKRRGWTWEEAETRLAERWKAGEITETDLLVSMEMDDFVAEGKS